jgi:hypothetical protein
MTCDAADAPAWIPGYHACASGGEHADETDKFIMIGQNQCGVTDSIPSAMALSIANLEKIPNPPWRTWLQ